MKAFVANKTSKAYAILSGEEPSKLYKAVILIDPNSDVMRAETELPPVEAPTEIEAISKAADAVFRMSENQGLYHQMIRFDHQNQ
jgi:hypothetical protein